MLGVRKTSVTIILVKTAWYRPTDNTLMMTDRTAILKRKKGVGGGGGGRRGRGVGKKKKKLNKNKMMKKVTNYDNYDDGHTFSPII